MMTDRIKLKKMLTKAGVEDKVESPTKIVVEAKHGSHPTNPGYNNLCSEFLFDANGDLISIGCWE